MPVTFQVSAQYYQYLPNNRHLSEKIGVSDISDIFKI